MAGRGEGGGAGWGQGGTVGGILSRRGSVDSAISLEVFSDIFMGLF